MERAALDRIERKIEEEVKTRFPGDAVQRVTLLQYGDDPVVEPGELAVRVFIKSAAGPEGDERSLGAFERDHRSAIKELRDELSRRLPEVKRLEFLAGDGECDGKVKGPRIFLRTGGGLADRAAGGDFTPVMARLGPEDLETLDALITAGIATSRAEAVRWALARIRERPAYAKLRERVREIEELKAQF
jgi:hypothetical protein